MSEHHLAGYLHHICCGVSRVFEAVDSRGIPEDALAETLPADLQQLLVNVFSDASEYPMGLSANDSSSVQPLSFASLREATRMWHRQSLSSFAQWAEAEVKLPVRPLEDQLRLLRGDSDPQADLLLLTEAIVFHILSLHLPSASPNPLTPHSPFSSPFPTFTTLPSPAPTPTTLPTTHTHALYFLYWLLRFAPEFHVGVHSCQTPQDFIQHPPIALVSAESPQHPTRPPLDSSLLATTIVPYTIDLMAPLEHAPPPTQRYMVHHPRKLIHELLQALHCSALHTSNAALWSFVKAAAANTDLLAPPPPPPQKPLSLFAIPPPPAPAPKARLSLLHTAPADLHFNPPPKPPTTPSLTPQKPNPIYSPDPSMVPVKPKLFKFPSSPQPPSLLGAKFPRAVSTAAPSYASHPTSTSSSPPLQPPTPSAEPLDLRTDIPPSTTDPHRPTPPATALPPAGRAAGPPNVRLSFTEVVMSILNREDPLPSSQYPTCSPKSSTTLPSNPHLRAPTTTPATRRSTTAPTRPQRPTPYSSKPPPLSTSSTRPLLGKQPHSTSTSPYASPEPSPPHTPPITSATRRRRSITRTTSPYAALPTFPPTRPPAAPPRKEPSTPLLVPTAASCQQRQPRSGSQRGPRWARRLLPLSCTGQEV